MANAFKCSGKRLSRSASGTSSEWYFDTYRSTIWRAVPGEWMNDALIAFAFNGKPQDVDRFLNEPFWRERAPWMA